MKKNVNMRDQNKLRIIGGKWRGRKLSFPNAEGLRPTGDRIRETLFNWLAPFITEANVLDLFAGSGALGFEAASRMANQVILVEKNLQVAKQLKLNMQLLSCENVTVINKDALNFIDNCQFQPFNLVFLDPPFTSDLINKVIPKLKTSGLLTQDAIIYIETPLQTQIKLVIDDWHLLKEKTAGNVCYRLLQANCG